MEQLKQKRTLFEELTFSWSIGPNVVAESGGPTTHSKHLSTILPLEGRYNIRGRKADATSRYIYASVLSHAHCILTEEQSLWSKDQLISRSDCLKPKIITLRTEECCKVSTCFIIDNANSYKCVVYTNFKTTKPTHALRKLDYLVSSIRCTLSILSSNYTRSFKKVLLLS